MTAALAIPRPAMTVARAPHWLDQAQRRDLVHAITGLLTKVQVLPAHRALLDAVLTELGVAEARDHMWPTKTEIVRQASGYSSDVLPIRMSREEHAAVLTIPSLPMSVRSALAGGSEN